MNTQPEGADGKPRRPGRVRAAFLALRGHPVVPEQIRAEWAAWQLELEAICDKISAAASRMNTRNKRDLDRALKELEDLRSDSDTERGPAPSHGGMSWNPTKRELNRRMLAARGIRVPGMRPPNGSDADVDGTEASE